MAFRRPFTGGGGRRFDNNNRGSYKAGRSFRDNKSENNEQNYELRGILWGNKFRDEQKANAPVLQGYATVDGVKYRVSGFLNVGADFRDDRSAQKEKEALAGEINNILLDGQENLGLAFSLVFEDPDSEEAQARSSNRATPRRSNRRDEEEEQEDVPFNRDRDDDDEEEPVDEDAPKPARAPRKPASAKKPAKTVTKSAKSKRSGK